ncbi:hypothetical protein BKA83DRAFT_2941586 [Pisolithus microcarpus]|nr:hypothetical protein BKA83DRAFT_2941586 [Pisolithus microcarpus]
MVVRALEVRGGSGQVDHVLPSLRLSTANHVDEILQLVLPFVRRYVCWLRTCRADGERLRSPRNLFCVVSSARVSAKLGETIPSKRSVYYHFFVWKGTVTQPLSCLLGDNNWNIVQRLSSRVHRSPSVSYCTVLSPFPASRKTQALFTPHLSSGTSVGKHRGHLHKVSPSFHGITLTCPPITTTLGHSMAISTLPHQYFSLPKRPLYIRMSGSTMFRMRWVSQYQTKLPSMF